MATAAEEAVFSKENGSANDDGGGDNVNKKNETTILITLPPRGTDEDSFVRDDPLTDETYSRYGFDPKKNTSDCSYTASRVANPVYLKNVDPKHNGSAFEHYGYLTTWSQYDGRLTGNFEKSACGRGRDLMNINFDLYSGVVLAFSAIVGDQGVNAATIKNAADEYKRKENEVTFVDPWGDVRSFTNVGFEKYKEIRLPEDFHEDKVQGIVGGLRRINEMRRAEKKPDLPVYICVGGWTQSERFHHMCKDPEAMDAFVRSCLDILERFKMVRGFDLDWEYPGTGGEPHNKYGPEDCENFCALIRRLKAALPEWCKITVALAGTVENLKNVKVSDLDDAGVDRFFVMTYDYGGSFDADKRLKHHTNLKPHGPEEHSVHTVVQYLLLKEGIASKKIFIGYANYTRNMKNAILEDTHDSSLEGSFENDSTPIFGTFEHGTSDLPDVLYNYCDFSGYPINNYTIYTDHVRCAQYLYNEELKTFISLDTPYSVVKKCEYVKQFHLGGIFAYPLDNDHGLLSNVVADLFGYRTTADTITSSDKEILV